VRGDLARRVDRFVLRKPTLCPLLPARRPVSTPYLVLTFAVVLQSSKSKLNVVIKSLRNKERFVCSLKSEFIKATLFFNYL